MFVRLIGFSLLRMLRDYLGHVFLLVAPLVLISIFGIITDYVSDEINGRPVLDLLSVSFVFAFQLFGGAYTMDLLHQDLLSTRKWRIYSLPISINQYGNSLLLSSTLFSMLQGLVLVLFTQWVFGVEWGNLLWVTLVLLAVSLLSQLVCLLLVLSIKSYKLAQRIVEVYGFSSMIFANIFFITLPDNAFSNFMNAYGNPISLGRNAIFGMVDGKDSTTALLSVGVLLALSIALFLIANPIGKRRLS